MASRVKALFSYWDRVFLVFHFVIFPLIGIKTTVGSQLALMKKDTSANVCNFLLLKTKFEWEIFRLSSYTLPQKAPVWSLVQGQG